jgi:hypothetical protein
LLRATAGVLRLLRTSKEASSEIPVSKVPVNQLQIEPLLLIFYHHPAGKGLGINVGATGDEAYAFSPQPLA